MKRRAPTTAAPPNMLARRALLDPLACRRKRSLVPILHVGVIVAQCLAVKPNSADEYQSINLHSESHLA